MLTLVAWILLCTALVVFARTTARTIAQMWPALVFGLFPAVRVASIVRTSGSAHIADLLQQFATLGFLVVLVVLFAVRSPVRGARADPRSAAVAVLGTFILMLAAALPAGAEVASKQLLVSSTLIFSGTVFAIWGLLVLGRCFGLFPEVRGLVLRGPYRMVRHPVYVGEIVAACGTFVARPQPYMLALCIAFIALQYWRTVFEERALLTEFPAEYETYRQRVPRLVPGL